MERDGNWNIENGDWEADAPNDARATPEERVLPRGEDMLEVIDEVPGTSELVKWFGYWPSFHDAEVLDFKLRRTGSSAVRVHTWEITNQVNGKGYFIRTKHVIVSFVFDGVTDLHLEGFNGQNVIGGLHLRQTDAGYELRLEPCFGVEGTVAASHVHVEFELGIPSDSQDLKSPGT